MASDTEGIAALFSMYNDDEEEEDADEPSPPFPALPAAVTSSSPLSPQAGAEDPNPSVAPPSPSRPEELASLKTLASPHPSPARGLLPPLPSRRSSSPFAVSSPSPLRGPFFAPPADLPRPPRRGALAIVDYAHDETAMSPEQEDGEITSNTYGFGSDAQAAEGNLEERTYSGTVHVMTPNTLAELSQHPDAPEQNQVGTDMAVDVTRTEIKGAQVEGTTDISTNGESDDPSNRFLPPPVTTKCSAALQQKINRFLAYRRAGKSFNAEVRNRKDYRNPDFLQHAVGYQEIDQIGTCFSKYVFDPYGYDKGDYYDEIEAEMKREVERKEQEKKRSPKVEFITGVQPPINASIPKIPGLAGVCTLPVPTEGVQKETRPNKKSKWDKVDGDVKNHVVPSGHDNLSATTAALLTSANVGAGYAGFAQQKRKEAEEKKNDHKSDRRS
ncbi:transcription regulator [Zea mays]|uniref:Transcription regulator n=2 Tax=Zea mays TaxID=4577 RepID=B6TMA7_MAIZE|nr:transcription regulator [Zea mays]ACG38240.1 transcription regulator [Zea mays]|eukprot:NP_001150202.1 transcription regulator [Zea mays]